LYPQQRLLITINCEIEQSEVVSVEDLECYGQDVGINPQAKTNLVLDLPFDSYYFSRGSLLQLFKLVIPKSCAPSLSIDIIQKPQFASIDVGQGVVVAIVDQILWEDVIEFNVTATFRQASATQTIRITLTYDIPVQTSNITVTDV